MRPGHVFVHLGDDRTADVQRGHQVVGGEPEAVLAACVGRTDLNHDDIRTNRTAANQRCQLRVRHGQDLEHAGLGERAVRADAAVGRKP
jgi:hypothetical protein